MLYATEPVLVWSNLETQIRAGTGPAGPQLKSEVLPCSMVRFVQRVVLGKAKGVHVAMQDGRDFEFVISSSDDDSLSRWLGEAGACVGHQLGRTPMSPGVHGGNTEGSHSPPCS